MNKKGMSQGAVILISVFLLVAAMGVGGWFFLNKTDEQTNKIIQSTQQQTQTQTETSNKGQVSTLKILAYDRSQNDQSNQTTVPTYCVKGENGETKLIADALALSKTARVNQPVRIGDVVKCIALNNTYYGAWKEITIKDETEFMDLDNWAIARQIDTEITLFNKDRTASGVANGTINFTGSSPGSSPSISAIRFKINKTDVTYNLAGITIDQFKNAGNATSSIIDDIDLENGPFSGTLYSDEDGATLLERLKTLSEYYFEFDSNPGTPEKEAIFLEENDEVEFGKMTLTMDSGITCAGYAGCEELVLRFYDKAYYRSTKEQTVKGPAAENDADSPSDVGSSGTGSEPEIKLFVTN